MNPHEATRDPRIEIGQGKLDEGCAKARHALSQLESLHLPGEPERQARKGLALLRSAMDWLEDTKDFERAHERLDDAGRQVRTSFGCHLSFEAASGYSQECPVALAHNRVGMSAGFIVDAAECSICRQDPEDCDHITGQRYGDETCVRVVTQAKLLEVSLVARPKQPEARIQSVAISRNELQRALGAEFRFGVPVSCDRCLQACEGLTEVPGVHA